MSILVEAYPKTGNLHLPIHTLKLAQRLSSANKNEKKELIYKLLGQTKKNQNIHEYLANVITQLHGLQKIPLLSENRLAKFFEKDPGSVILAILLDTNDQSWTQNEKENTYKTNARDQTNWQNILMVGVIAGLCGYFGIKLATLNIKNI